MENDPGRFHRHSIRLDGNDYSSSGLYFVTICTHNRENRFGEVLGENMHLNQYGKIAWMEWRQLPVRFPNINLVKFVVMPNHVHGIIEITREGISPANTKNGQPPEVGAGFTPAHSQTGEPPEVGVGFTPLTST